MDIKEILHFADDLVFAHTGKHLDKTQQLIIEGVWQNNSYQEIADKCYLSESRVRNIGSQLLKILSESLGEDINKNNFCWTIERAINSQLINIVNGNVNYCHNGIQESSKNKRNSITNNKYHDLTLAPKLFNFHGRENDLKAIYNWIFNQNISLISVSGLSGIGKSSLVKRFVDLNLDKLEIIIWKSLKFPKSLDLLVNDLLNVCQEEVKKNLDDNLQQLFEIFTNKKCLIILDNLEVIFAPQQFAGQYQTQYQDYQNFFKMITETNHQSHIILISQEQCTEMVCLDEELYPIKCLDLDGLSDRELLRNWGLKDEDSWLDLINLYKGNLFYLKSIAMLINNNYDGQVADFLEENTLLITNQMQSHFREIFNHLSPPEKEIALQLSKVEQLMTREDLSQSLNLSSVDFNNGL